MVLASEYLERNYPPEGVCLIDDDYNNKGKKRSEIKELVLRQKNLSGTLNVSDFVQLEELYCWGNQLTYLILPPNNKLRIIGCANNHLTDFDYTQLNPHICTDLRLFNNNLAPTDLAVFSPLVNLTILDIGNENDWVEQGQGNQFYGSLVALDNCPKLNYLAITNTNINQGLEYLPESLETFVCYSWAGTNWQVQEIEQEIKQWGNSLKEYQKLLGEWKKQGFSVQEVEKWKKAGLALNDHLLAHYLQQDGYQPQQITKDNLSELREKTAWQDLHEDFDSHCQIRAEWEAKSLNYSDAKQWLDLGFQPSDYDNSWLNLGIKETKEWFALGFDKQNLSLVKRWRENGFNHQSAKEWINNDFKLEDYDKANGWKLIKINAQKSQEWLSIGFNK
ncbi:MAG: hypothetical protein GBAus27B_000073 [Mycoplasmataceae bacterium]|nr:MAG: hypothetical protein GBAus27B_000073 [Mycoplasmataceae bacterium]